MPNNKWFTFVFSTAIIGSGLIALPAKADLTQSDITGTNIWNNTAPIFQNQGKINPEIVNNARRLSQELDKANKRCCDASAAVGPRRFARGSGNTNQECVNTDCQQLSSVVQESNTFLNEVNRYQMELQQTSKNRTW
jgi:hypothetical protein